MTEPEPRADDAPGAQRPIEPAPSPLVAEPPSAPYADNTRLESLMAEVPPLSPGWSAPASRTPEVAQWMGVGAFVIGLAVVLDLALVRQGQRSIVAGGVLGLILLTGVGLAIAAIVGGIRVRSTNDSDTSARTRAAIAIGLAGVALLLIILAGLELYAIGLDAL